MRNSSVFRGVKVLEWTQAGNGPWTGRFFADFGAEVIKIESNTFPDFVRLNTPFKDGIPHPDRSPRFSTFNTGKKSLTLNMKDQRGLEIFRRLVGWADIVLHNQRPGLMKKMGLGYEALKEIKEDIILLEVSIVGQDGPLAGIGGFGNNSMGQSGQFYYYRHPGGDPLLAGFTATPDVVAPIFAVMAGIIALDQRNRTGEGQSIDVCQLEVMVHFLNYAVLDYTINSRIQEPVGNRNPHAAPHNVFRCKGLDSWCAIAVFTEEEWKCFCGVMGNPEWAMSPKFSAVKERKRNEDELDQLINEWTIQYTADEVMKMMQAAGVPAGKVQNAEDIVEYDPQVKARDLLPRCHHPVIGDFLHARWPFIMSKTPNVIKSTPCLGEHNWYVCSQILGMSEQEFEEMVNMGAIN